MNDYGKYFPPTQTKIRIFDLIKRLGLSRGIVRKWISKQWYKENIKLVDTIINGIKYRLNILVNTTDMKILTSSKFYDKTEIFQLANTHRKAVFVDIGANTGYYSLNLAKLGFSKIVAIEPNPPTLEILKYNIQINNYEEVISVVNFGIGSGETIPFYCSGGLGDASMHKLDDVTEPIYVKTKSLLDVIKEQKIESIDALKIDIEGYEDKALIPFFETASRKMWPKRVVIEDCHMSRWEQDIIEKMKNIGYKIIKKTRGNIILECE